MKFSLGFSFATAGGHGTLCPSESVLDPFRNDQKKKEIEY